MNWKSLIATIVPIILASNPKTAKLAPFVVSGIQVAEELPGKKGKDKLDAAVSIAKLGLQAANAQLGRDVIDLEVADEIIESAASAGVDAVNIIHNATKLVNKEPSPSI